jgi:hypothetical protein
MVSIHVALLDEGTLVWRPVQARHVRGAVYEILGIVPAGEKWEFQPGQLVECKQHVFAGGSSGLASFRSVGA